MFEHTKIGHVVFRESVSGIGQYKFHPESLSVVVPVRFPSEHLPNLFKIVFECKGSGIDLIVVIDTAPGIGFDADIQESLEKHGAKVVVGYFGNPGDARNVGLEWALSEWVMFWDVDDEPNIRNIESIINSSSKEVDLIVGSFSVKHLDESRKKSVVRKKENLFEAKQVAWDPGIWRIIFRRDFIQGLVFPSLKLGEDQVFISKTLIRHPRISYLEKILYTYVKGGSGQVTKISSNFEKAFNQLEAALTIMRLNDVLHKNCATCGIIRRIEWKLSIGFIGRLGVVGLLIYPINFKDKRLFLRTLRKLGIARHWKYAFELHEKRKR